MRSKFARCRTMAESKRAIRLLTRLHFSTPLIDGIHRLSSTFLAVRPRLDKNSSDLFSRRRHDFPRGAFNGPSNSPSGLRDSSRSPCGQSGSISASRASPLDRRLTKIARARCSRGHRKTLPPIQGRYEHTNVCEYQLLHGAAPLRRLFIRLLLLGRGIDQRSHAARLPVY